MNRIRQYSFLTQQTSNPKNGRINKNFELMEVSFLKNTHAHTLMAKSMFIAQKKIENLLP